MKLRPIDTVSLFDGNQSKEIKGNVRRWKKFPFKISIHPFVDLIDTGVQGVSIIGYNLQTAASGWKNELEMRFRFRESEASVCQIYVNLANYYPDESGQSIEAWHLKISWNRRIRISHLKSRLLENRICKFADYPCIELILHKFCSTAFAYFLIWKNLLSIVYSSNLHILNKFVVWNNFISTYVFT